MLEWLRRKFAALLRRRYCDKILEPVVESALKLNAMVKATVTEPTPEG
jgi:hypothetical protein